MTFYVIVSFMAVTIQKCEEMIEAYLAAEEALVTNNVQSYTINGRTLTKLNLADIRAGLKLWETRLNNLKNGVSGGVIVRSIIAHG